MQSKAKIRRFHRKFKMATARIDSLFQKNIVSKYIMYLILYLHVIRNFG